MHSYLEGAIGTRSLDRNLPLIGKFDRIADEVEQHLGDAAFVPPAGRQIGSKLDVQGNLFLQCQGLDQAEHGLHDILERIIGKGEAELPCLDLGEVKHVVNQAEEVLAVALDALKDGAHLLRRLPINVVNNELGIAEDGVERRSQLVAHIGEKLRFVLACFLKLAAFFLKLSRTLEQFVEQAHVLDGDHGLIGEIGDQRDLLVGEWAHLLPVDDNRADELVVLEHRHAEKAPGPSKLNGGNAKGL